MKQCLIHVEQSKIHEVVWELEIVCPFIYNECIYLFQNAYISHIHNFLSKTFWSSQRALHKMETTFIQRPLNKIL